MFNSHTNQRRRLLLGLGALHLPWALPSSAANADAAALQALAQGGCVVLLRHALTVPGIGDPPGMRLDDCSSQRDLSEEGRSQSRRIGQWFRRHALTPARVRSSQWCRCLNTAREAFGGASAGRALAIEPWTPLNSFFQGHGNRHAQITEAIAEARMLSLRKASGQFEVWVTHQVSITALTGRYVSMGELLVAAYESPEKPLRVLASGLAF